MKGDGVTAEVLEGATHPPSRDDAPLPTAPETSQDTRGAADKPVAPNRDPSGEAPSLAAADRVRFVQRVARAVEAARPDGELRLRLRPPELGSLYLRVRTEEGALAAQIETESPQTRALLAEHLPELRQRLAEMNIRVERFDIEWRGGGADAQPQSFGRQGGSSDGHSAFGQRTIPNREAPQDRLAHAPRSRPHRGDLDVVV